MTLFNPKSDPEQPVALAKFAERNKPRVGRTSWLVPRPATAPFAAATATKGGERADKPPTMPPMPPPRLPREATERAAADRGRGDSVAVDAVPAPSFSARPPPPAESFRPPPARVSPLADPHTKMIVDRFEGAIAELGQTRSDAVRQSEKEVVELAIAIARRVIAREVTTDRTLILRLAGSGLEAIGQADRVTIRLGQELEETLLKGFRDRLASKGTRAEIVFDPSLGPGGCIVETELGRVDESIEARLDLLVAALSAEGGSEPP